MRNLKRCKIIYFISRILLLFFILDVYFSKTGMSIYLLKYGIKNHFDDDKRWFTLAITIIVLFLLEAICNYFIVTNKVRLRYDITILRPHIKEFRIYVTNLMRAVNVFIVIVAAIGIAFTGFDTMLPPSNRIEWNGSKIVGHSFGEIDGETYTGCLEAFEKKYNEGLRSFEVDFARTSDGSIVLRHGWGIQLQDFGKPDYVATEEEFKSKKILGKYTPLTLEDLLLLMDEYDDIWIITDSKRRDPNEAKSDFEKLVEVAKQMGCEKCLDRIVVQFYSEDMYEAIREVYDFKGYIFTLYMRWDSTFEQYTDIVRWCAANDIHIITMWSDLAENVDVITYAKKYDIDIYVHTVNDVGEARTRLYDGVKGIYTDEITPEMLR